MLVCGVLLCILLHPAAGVWENWWTYTDGVSGPENWSDFVPAWRICKEGRQQSPINIEPARLLFDKHLRTVYVDKDRVRGILRNTGHDVTLTADPSRTANISGGPLSYQYTFEKLQLHFGLVPDDWRRSSRHVAGSEHVVNGKRFPAEIHLMGYNSHLYRNYSEAVDQSHGVVGIAILVQIEGVSLVGLLPNTEQYITYEGSITSPACQETVTWIVFNKPIYMSHHQLPILKQLKQRSRNAPDQDSLGNNYRPVQRLNNRVVRTNIDFEPKDGNICPPMKHDMRYKAGKWLGV
ncbi:Carbonic anhydrase-related protein 10 [Amphibalanus amphitrite]|uniref:Carbonic anhydrase n=1 Tax=Amphibalanus amphitrite TaxID=1232801 RepID=A0A6A4W4V9_AMPAM|nr:Carbonic anhydrase-related protein 10 [Amphibalanus amphitrite]